MRGDVVNLLFRVYFVRYRTYFYGTLSVDLVLVHVANALTFKPVFSFSIGLLDSDDI